MNFNHLISAQSLETDISPRQFLPPVAVPVQVKNSLNSSISMNWAQ
jgi:hypothetical protein